jgi:hypothetical protein
MQRDCKEIMIEQEEEQIYKNGNCRWDDNKNFGSHAELLQCDNRLN